MINCFEPSFGVVDFEALKGALDSRAVGFGATVSKFEQEYSSLSDKKFNIGLNSASSAAFILYAYLYERHGECVVYAPSLTFTSTVWAATHFGHKIVFVDVDQNALFDFEHYKKIRSFSHQRAVVMPTLYGGVSHFSNEDYFGDEIVVVDSAHCVSPRCYSDYIFFSFHPVKPIAMSTGGLVSTNNKDFDKFCRSYRNFGREPADHSYTISSGGFNFYMNSLNASLGLAQLQRVFEFIKKRQENFEQITEQCENAQFLHHDVSSSYYLGTLVLPKDVDNKSFIEYSKKCGVQSTLHYPPLHLTKYYETDKITLRNTEYICKHLINFPIHQNLSREEVKKISGVLKRVF